ncbi:flagellar biosynthesis protein FlhA [Schlesneria sp. DSM 10557]|uniref:flagellar biosynthesis protein FlhA n=1 Tax=Schlesneria sp. DSM 10557 TaxID=3044399 RepID=UPI00359F2A26
MTTAVGHGPHSVAGSSLGMVFPILVVLSVLVLIAPVPPVVLDLLLAANVTASVLILLTTISVRKPLEFSVFPSLLLVTTLVRLVLNVASTRLILTQGPTAGTEAAGVVIETFGRFVAQGQLIVGLILFAIIVVIQFVVVTKGATRISEVAARFSLDSLPGKQLAIDADVAAGTITQEQARLRRQELTDQADFHAAMDGAGKFVRGDAIAGVLITVINLVGGLSIGVIQHGMSIPNALEVYSTLTIGDGLVSQVPGFLIAIAAGLLATRSSRESNLSHDAAHQMFQEPTALFLAAAFASALAFTGLPMIPLATLAVGCVLIGLSVKSVTSSKTQAAASANSSPAVNSTQVHSVSPAQFKREQRPEDKLAIEPIELELGFRLIKLADPDAGGDLMDRVTQLRNKIALELGIILPKVKIRDSLRLSDCGYRIKLRNVTVASGVLRPEMLLAVNTGLVSGEVNGQDVIEPSTGRAAKWIESSQVENAKVCGYKVVEPAVVLMAHLAEIVKTHADELLTRQHVHQLLETLARTSPKVVEELIPTLLKPAQVHQILCNLLRENVPVRDLETILETLGTYADQTTNITTLTELVRNALSRTICQQYRDANRVIHAITLDPALEDVLCGGFEGSERGLSIKLTPQIIEGVTHELSRQTSRLTREGYLPVVVCSAQVRPVLRQITQSSLPKLAVLSLQEISRDTVVQPHGQVPINSIKIPQKRPLDGQKRHPLVAAMT